MSHPKPGGDCRAPLVRWGPLSRRAMVATWAVAAVGCTSVQHQAACPPPSSTELAVLRYFESRLTAGVRVARRTVDARAWLGGSSRSPPTWLAPSNWEAWRRRAACSVDLSVVMPPERLFVPGRDHVADSGGWAFLGRTLDVEGGVLLPVYSVSQHNELLGPVLPTASVRQYSWSGTSWTFNGDESIPGPADGERLFGP